jgi:hypothetical protein
MKSGKIIGSDVVAAKLAGRCANGMERGQGVTYHAMPLDQVRGTIEDPFREAWGWALCGAKPGRRSVGWTVCTGTKITCPRCLRKIEKGGVE